MPANLENSAVATGLEKKTEIMTSDPITSWQIDGETMDTVTDFILGGSQITADEIKRNLLLGGNAVAKLDSIL